MGKAKKQARKPAIEENEFLKDLIDEVQLDNSDTSDDEVSDDSLASPFDVLHPTTRDDNSFGQVDAMIGVDDESHGSKDDLPTMFAHIKSDIPAPELNSSKKSNEPEATIATNQETAVATPSEIAAARPEVNPETSTAAQAEADRTVAVAGARGNRGILQEKVVTGALKGTRNGQVYTSLDASLAQAETLKMAQTRIKELEVEVDRLRQENDDLASAGDVVTRRMEELQIRVHRIEKEKSEQADQSKSEMLILKGNLQYKESELAKTKAKLDDLDMRIKSDFRKIRVRERELENRLELVRGEKQALMRTKDEKILDLQRKLDQYKSEMDLYRSKVQDLNKLMESQRDQMQKTIRALRIALTNLEHDDSTEVASFESSSESASDNDSSSKKLKSS